MVEDSQYTGQSFLISSGSMKFPLKTDLTMWTPKTHLRANQGYLERTDEELQGRGEGQ